MKRKSNLKCSSNFFCFILLPKACLIIIAVYVLLTNHYREDENCFLRQPAVRRTQNWTQEYFGKTKYVSPPSNNSTQKPSSDLVKPLFFNRTKNRALTKAKKLKRHVQRNGKEKVIIFVGIFSAPRLIFRRNALRRSWLKQCKEHKIPCLFFTDGQDMHGKKLPLHIYVPLHQEQVLHGDLILVNSPGGINFARRYLWMLNWANARYKFKYFLRIDDDYFVCMERLLLELPRRQRKKLYWGHVHCQPRGRKCVRL